MKAKAIKLFNILRLITTLRFVKQWTAAEIVELSLGNPVLETIQVRSELLRFAEIVANLKPKTLLEIGTNKGGTLCILSRLATPDAVIISLDLPGGDFGGGYKGYHASIFKHFTRENQKIHLLRGDSHSVDMETAVREIVGNGKLDLLFIDGDHTYEGVKKDFESYLDLVRPGGVIAFHDIVEHTSILTCQVSRLWHEIKSRYRHEEIVESPSQGWAGIGILYV
jgi:predicted O-methyltransferase YrrM